MHHIDRRQLTGRWLAVTVCLAALTAVIPHWLKPGYYFDDDVRHYFMVFIHEIGGRLLQGEWPILTLRSLYSGNLIGEGQFGLTNPVTLLLYVIVSRIHNLGLGALIYAGFHLVMMAMGVFFLARRLALSPPYAALSALAFVCTNFNSYWYASSWWNALTTNTWVVWAAAAWLMVLEKRQWLLSVVLTTAAVLTGGWPHGALALLCVMVVFGWRQLQRDGLAAVAPPFLLGGIAALLLSLPVLVPLAEHVAESERSCVVMLRGGNMTATFGTLMSLSWPSFTTALPIFFGHRSNLPDFYAAWFILPLILVYRHSIPYCWRSADGYFKSLVILAGLFAIFSLGPEQIGPLRWPIRFVTYFQLFALLATAKLASEGREAQDTTAAFAGLWVLGFLLSWQQSADDSLWIHAMFAGLGFLGSCLAMAEKNHTARVVRLLVITVLIFAVTHYCWQRNSNIGHWPSPTEGQLKARNDKAGPPLAGNVMVMQGRVPDAAEEWRQLPSGNIGLWEGSSFVNGYSPIEFRGLHQQLCLNAWSWTCPKAVSRLLAVDAPSKQDLAALLRIVEVRVSRGVLADSMAELGPRQGFHLVGSTLLGDTWQRKAPDLPGTLSWVSPGIRVLKSEGYSSQREVIEVANQTTAPGRLVWARTAFQGYEATLDGVPLTIYPYNDILVSVEIPAGGKGRLALFYRPAGWRWTVPLAVAGLVLTLVAGRML